MNRRTIPAHAVHGISAIQQAVEDLLPAHVMALAIDKLYEQGYEIRLDTRGYLNNAIKKVLLRHTGQEMVVARRADALSDDIMRPVSFSDARVVLLAASYMLLKLVEEKLYLDQDSQAVLTALMIVADANEDENPDLNRLIPEAREKAAQMLNECLRVGLYRHAVVN